MSAMPWENEEERNFTCMNNIVNKVISESLRTVFKQEWNSRYQATVGAWDDTNVSGQQLSNLEQTRWRPSKTMIQSKFQIGDTSQWDCTVLFDAILYSNSIGSSLIPATRKEVDNLRTTRNIVVHDLGGRLCNSCFQAYTTDVENAFNAIGLPTKEITRIKVERNRYKSFQVLPPKPVHDVILRTENIREASEHLEVLRSAGKLTYFYISGNPGSGKSQLASQVCENIWQVVNWSEEQTFVMTLNGKDIDSLLNSYEDFARRLNCDESVLLNMLSSTKTTKEKIKDLRSLVTTRMKNWKKWWLVVDNVEDLEIVSPLLPQMGDDVWNHGQIIVTTQNRNHVPSDSSLTKQVSISRGMSNLESHQLLSSLSGFNCNDPILEKVAERLDRQPLAMTAAAVYFERVVKSTGKFSWHDYLKKLENGERQITEKQLSNINSAYASTMTAAVLLAVEKCAENDPCLKHAFQFLSFVSFESMPLDLFAKFIQLVHKNFNREESFCAIHQCSLFIAAENVDRDIRVHRVVHEIIQRFCESKKTAEIKHVLEGSGSGLEPNDVKCHFENVARTLYGFKDRSDKAKLVPHLKAFNEAVAKLYPKHEQFYEEGSSAETYDMFHMYIFFANTLNECYKHKLSLDFLTPCLQLSQRLENELCVADVCKSFGLAHEGICESKKAKMYHQKALEIRKKELGEGHVDVAACFNDLSTVLQITGEYEKAEDYLQRAIEIQKEKLGEKHVDVAISCNNLGKVYLRLGELREAHEYLQAALEILKEKLGEKHADVATSYNNLGTVYRITFDYDNAKDCHQRALEIEKEQFGEKHVNVACSYNSLGVLYQITGDYETANDYFQTAMKIRKAQLGEKHVDVAGSYNNLGALYKDVGKMKRAKEYFQQAVNIYKEKVGEKHVNVANSYINLGFIHRITSEYENARGFHYHALEIQKEHLGENYVDVANSYNNPGLVYQVTAYHDIAEDCFQRTVKCFKQQLGERHFNVAASYYNLGVVYENTGNYGKAIECFLLALEIHEEQLGGRHVFTAVLYDGVGEAYRHTGEIDKAKDYHQGALEIRKLQLGEKHVRVASSYHNLGRVYEITGKYEEAKDYYEQSLEIRKQQLGGEHVDVAASYSNLGLVCKIIGDYKKAKDYHLRALKIRKQHLGETHAHVADSYNSLGIVYHIIGEQKKAKDCLQRALEIQKEQRIRTKTC